MTKSKIDDFHHLLKSLNTRYIHMTWLFRRQTELDESIISTFVEMVELHAQLREMFPEKDRTVH